MGAECLYSSCSLHDTVRKVLLQMFHYETKTKPQPSVGSHGAWNCNRNEIVNAKKKQKKQKKPANKIEIYSF